MTEAVLDIKQWGNNLGVRLPAAVARAARSKAGKTSYVLCHQPKSFDWRMHGARAHLLKSLPAVPFADVCRRLNQIIQLG